MSLLDIFRRKNNENDKLKEQLALLKKENEIFLEEIRALKKILFNIDISLGKKKKSKKS